MENGRVKKKQFFGIQFNLIFKTYDKKLSDAFLKFNITLRLSFNYFLSPESYRNRQYRTI